MVEGHDGAKLLTSVCLGSREAGRKGLGIRGILQSHFPRDFLPPIRLHFLMSIQYKLKWMTLVPPWSSRLWIALSAFSTGDFRGGTSYSNHHTNFAPFLTEGLNILLVFKLGHSLFCCWIFSVLHIVWTQALCQIHKAFIPELL
jgi:hypothetical protein